MIRYSPTEKINTKYRQDWLDSGVDDGIINLNVEAIAGADLFSVLYPHPQRLNAGRLNAKYLRLWERCVDFDNTPLSHGWLCNGRVKILEGPILAPDEKGKVNKYRNPEGGKAPITFLKVPLHIWAMVAKRHGVAMPEHITITEQGEAGGFWEWVLENKIPVVLTEGEKKAGCLLTRGYAAISVPGINMGYRATDKDFWGRAKVRELLPDLLPFDDGRSITIAFDYRPGGFFKSREWRAADTFAWQFHNSNVKIAQLPGPQKGVDDFAVAGGDVERLIGTAKPIARVRADELWNLSHFVAWWCNQQYLQGLPIPLAGLAFIKSAKGTGKTYNLKSITEEAAREGRKVLLLTHRIVLGRAICDVVGLTWIEDRFSSDEDRVDSQLFGYGLCVDSLHPTSQAKFNPEDWEGAIVIIDEIEQVIWHLLSSSTCLENRVAILDSLKQLINVVLESGGLIIGQDADLTDISINFILGFKEGDKPQPWLAVNEYKPQEPWLVTIYNTQRQKCDDGVSPDDPSGLLWDTVNHVNEDGGKVWLQVDAQKAKSKYGTVNLEKFFAKECPGARILRIDQTTVGNPHHAAYQCSAHINEIAKNYDIVICSPSLATGVSVDLRSHFTLVCGIFQGACSDNEVRQALARVREAVPRWVWIRQRAVAQIGNGSSSWFAVANSKTKDCRYNLQLLKDYEFELEGNFDPIAFRTWAKMAARVNASVWDYRNAVTEGLEAEGHLIDFSSETDHHANAVLKEIRQDSQIEKAELKAAAKVIDWKEREALAKKRSKTDEERYAEEKYDLKERYGVDVTPELCQLSEDSWYPKIQLHYYLTHKPEYLQMRDWKHIEGHRRRGNGKICPQDVRLLQLKVKIHLALGTLNFARPELELAKDSPEVQEFVRKALVCRREIKDICGISISEERANKDPVGIVGAFLKQLGLKLKGEQRRKGDERERVYKFGGTAKVNVYSRKSLIGKTIDEPEGLREQIFSQWETRDTEALQTWESSMACSVSGLAVTAPSVTVNSDFLENVTATTKNLDIENAVTKSSTNPVEKIWGVARELAEVAARVAEGAIEVATNSLRQVIKSFGIDKVFEALDSLPEHQRLAIEGIG